MPRCAKSRARGHPILTYLQDVYSSIAIEGGMVRQTTFATWLAEELGAELMLERFEENPFLEKFYDNPEAHGFSVELSFLADRYKQMQAAIRGRNLFKQRMVSDYSFVKSLIFAKVNLPKDEFNLFKTMFTMMHAQLPQPEVVAILDPGRVRQEAQIETGSVLRTIASRGLFGPVAQATPPITSMRVIRILWTTRPIWTSWPNPKPLSC